MENNVLKSDTNGIDSTTFVSATFQLKRSEKSKQCRALCLVRLAAAVPFFHQPILWLVGAGLCSVFTQGHRE